MSHTAHEFQTKNYENCIVTHYSDSDDDQLFDYCEASTSKTKESSQQTKQDFDNESIGIEPEQLEAASLNHEELFIFLEALLDRMKTYLNQFDEDVHTSWMKTQILLTRIAVVKLYKIYNTSELDRINGTSYLKSAKCNKEETSSVTPEREEGTRWTFPKKQSSLPKPSLETSSHNKSGHHKEAKQLNRKLARTPFKSVQPGIQYVTEQQLMTSNDLDDILHMDFESVIPVTQLERKNTALSGTTDVQAQIKKGKSLPGKMGKTSNSSLTGSASSKRSLGTGDQISRNLRSSVPILQVKNQKKSALEKMSTVKRANVQLKIKKRKSLPGKIYKTSTSSLTKNASHKRRSFGPGHHSSMTLRSTLSPPGKDNPASMDLESPASEPVPDSTVQIAKKKNTRSNTTINRPNVQAKIQTRKSLPIKKAKTLNRSSTSKSPLYRQRLGIDHYSYKKLKTELESTIRPRTHDDMEKKGTRHSLRLQEFAQDREIFYCDKLTARALKLGSSTIADTTQKVKKTPEKSLSKPVVKDIALKAANQSPSTSKNTKLNKKKRTNKKRSASLGTSGSSTLKSVSRKRKTTSSGAGLQKTAKVNDGSSTSDQEKDIGNANESRRRKLYSPESWLTTLDLTPA